MLNAARLAACMVLLICLPLTGDDWNIEQDPARLSIKLGERSVLTYNKTPPPLPEGVEPIYRRSGFLHPVMSPQGSIVTAVYPKDHKHQDGIFSAWVKTSYDGRELDFWNIAKKSGRVTHLRVVSTQVSKQQAGFVVELLHQTQDATPLDVLKETWKVTCYRTDGQFFVFDIETEQVALTDKPLTIEEYHYGGMALRGPTEWLLKKGKDSPVSRFLNSLGSDRKEGNHQAVNWVALTGKADSGAATIAVLSHTENYRAPQTARLHPNKPYFCYAPCVQGSFAIEKNRPLRNRYRYLVTDDEPDADWLDEQWRVWTRR